MRPGTSSFNGHGVAFGGDLLFAGSIGRTDLPLADPSRMDASLERMSASSPDDIDRAIPAMVRARRSVENVETNPFLTGAARIVRR